MPTISVLMSVYKEPEHYLRSAVESIIRQSYCDFEYIIVLDNPDNKNAKRVLEEYSNSDSRIILLYNQENIGLTKSLNKALEVASGTYIARMDADDISEEDRLSTQLAYLLKNNLDMVGCSLRRISESGNVVNELTNPSYPAECISKLLRYDDCVPHPSWLVKREVYSRLDGYRDIHSCEDYDFLLRADQRGFRIGICDSILLNYRINTQGISRTNGLKQMLTSHYLQTNFGRIDDVTDDEINDYLAKKLTKSRAIQYEKALTVLNDVIEDLKKRKWTSIFKLSIAVLTSHYVICNIKKIAVMQYIKKNREVMENKVCIL